MGAVFDRLSLKQKIMALTGLVFLVAILLLSVVFDRVIVHREQSRAEEEMTRLMTQADATAKTYLQLMKEDLIALSRNGDLRQGGALTVYLGNPGALAGRVEMDPEYMTGYELTAFNIMQRYGNAHGVKAASLSLAMRDGGYVSFPAEAKDDKFDPRKENWYQEALASPGKVVVSRPVHSVIATPVIRAAATVLDWGGNPLGVLAMDMDLAALNELTGFLELGDLGNLLLLDNENYILIDEIHPGAAFKKLEDAELGDISVLGPRTGGMRRVIVAGEEKYAAVYTSESTGLKYIALLDGDKLMAGVGQMRLILFLVLALALAAALAGSYWLTNKITLPLRVLEEKADSIAAGNLASSQDVVESDDEFGRLSFAFQEMGGKLKSQVEGLKQAAAETINAAEGLAKNITAFRKAAHQTQDKTEAALEVMEQSQDQDPAEIMERLAARQAEISSNKDKAVQEETWRELIALWRESEVALTQGKAKVEAAGETLKTLKELLERGGMPATNLRAAFQKINEVIRTATEISEQTNLLALNAAVESSRYNGKAKSKFTAVAEEIRKLSGQAGEAAKAGETILEAIAADIESLTGLWQEGQELAGQGRKDSLRAGELLRDLTKNGQQQREKEEQIRTATKDISPQENPLLEEVRVLINKYRQKTQSYAQNMAEIKAALAVERESTLPLREGEEDLLKAAKELAMQADKFKV